MKKILIILSGLLIPFLPLKADEGMWLMMLLNKNIDQMQALGLQLTAEDIYNVNHSSIKDGVVQYGGGCTGEIISSQGLLLTNHHCGFGAVQSLSTEKNNYLRDGFWAKTLKDELPCEGLTVKFFIKMEDVSTTVLAQLNDNMTEPQRNEAIEKVSQEIMTAYSEQGKYLVKVSNMFNANAFYVFVYQEYKDVRLVGVVPESLGKYGGDTDNWMWPRHTADFSLFRVYTAPDGQPATYSEKNIPLKPKFHFPVSTSGVKEDDFAMIIGFPGRTDRYLSSYGVKMAMQEKNPTIVKVRDVKLDIMKNFSQKDPKIELQYAAKMSGISNYWKYYIGQTEQLEKNKVYDKKVAIEDAFRAWIKNNNKQSEYGQVLSDMAGAYVQKQALEKYYNLYAECIASGPEIFRMANQFRPLYQYMTTMAQQKSSGKAISSADSLRFVSLLENYKNALPKFYKDYSIEVDQALTEKLLELFYQGTTDQQHSDLLNKIVAKNKQNFKKITQSLFKGSIFDQEKTVLQFLENPKVEVLENDPVYALNQAIRDNFKAIYGTLEPANELLAKANRLFVKGLMEMNPKTNYYPNADLSIRLTYGKVAGYEPQDAVSYKYYSTLEGVMAKYKAGDWDFDLPEKMLKLYQNKDFGPYAQDGQVRVCFLTTNDITGGNSGSPVINGKGQLIGCVFDGNWEAMCGDIYFDSKYKRAICVDVRYILFLIDKLGHGQRIIKELDLVNN